MSANETTETSLLSKAPQGLQSIVKFEDQWSGQQFSTLSASKSHGGLIKIRFTDPHPDSECVGKS